jgi:hypothetical protein
MLARWLKGVVGAVHGGDVVPSRRGAAAGVPERSKYWLDSSGRPAFAIPRRGRYQSKGFPMSHNSLNKSQLFAAATAISAVGFLTFPAPAQANPMFPLAPGCASYSWPGGGGFSVHAGNGTTTNMSTSQDRVVGRSFYLADGAQAADATYGNPSGGIIGGTSIDITINWDQGPGAGYAWHFVGKINDDGLASGTLHASNRDDAWSSSQKFSCITSATPPAPAPQAPAQPPPKTATVLKATDIYDLPDGKGTKYKNAQGKPIFKGPGPVTLVAPDLCRDNWCHVVAPEVPPGNGWIYIGEGLGTYTP